MWSRGTYLFVRRLRGSSRRSKAKTECADFKTGKTTSRIPREVAWERWRPAGVLLCFDFGKTKAENHFAGGMPALPSKDRAQT
jgi:hypothetical protein